MQTAIVIQYRGEEILVRLNGIHVPADQIDVDTRGRTWESWQPVEDSTVEVRLEGSPKGRDLSAAARERIADVISRAAPIEPSTESSTP